MNNNRQMNLRRFSFSCSGGESVAIKPNNWRSVISKREFIGGFEVGYIRSA